MKQCARSLSATAVPPIITIRVNGEDELAAGQEEGKKQISEGWDVTRVCVFSEVSEIPFYICSFCCLQDLQQPIGELAVGSCC